MHAVSVQVEYGGDVPRFSEYFLSFNEDSLHLCQYTKQPESICVVIPVCPLPFRPFLSILYRYETKTVMYNINQSRFTEAS